MPLDSCIDIPIDTRTATNDYSWGSTDCGTQPDVVIAFDGVEPGGSRRFYCLGEGAIDVVFDERFIDDPACPPELGSYVLNLRCSGEHEAVVLRGGDYPTVVCRDGALPPVTLRYCQGVL